MNQGLQLWDEQGRIILDTTYRTSQIFGLVTIAQASDSGSQTLVDDRLAKGTPFYFILGNTGKKGGSYSSKGIYGFYYPDNVAVSVNIPAKNIVVTFTDNVMTYAWNRSGIDDILLPINDAVIYYGAY